MAWGAFLGVMATTLSVSWQVTNLSYSTRSVQDRTTIFAALIQLAFYYAYRSFKV
jgi:hypothetical protein